MIGVLFGDNQSTVLLGFILRECPYHLLVGFLVQLLVHEIAVHFEKDATGVQDVVVEDGDLGVGEIALVVRLQGHRGHRVVSGTLLLKRFVHLEKSNTDCLLKENVL